MNKPVLVAGLGLSGMQAAGLLLKTGNEVILYDGSDKKDPAAVREQLRAFSDGADTLNIPVILGDLPDEIVDSVDTCVISPGISLEVPFAVKLQDAGVRIISEIELAWRYEKGTVIGITGTNGKTTTTTLVGDIMREYLGADRAFTTGNIGLPYAEEVLRTSADSVTTIELSSFQLESIETFRPHVSAILNITPDHLNRHHTMECYTEVKERIVENAGPEDVIILNYEDPRLRAFGESGLTPKVRWFSGLSELLDGYFLQGDTMYRAENGKKEVLLRTNDVNLVGRCNYENILAAIAVTEAMGVPEELILRVVRNFKAVPHRIEFTREFEGVRYYNDSKGTNPDAAIQGIRAMTGKTVLIGGGYDKGSEYDEWIEEFGDKIKLLILMGQTREKIAECAKRHGFSAIVFAESMEEAVRIAREHAEPGEAVLLSPACASWGMFDNYEQRGDIFKDLVNHLK